MIRAYTGLLGAGKTLAMINDAGPLLVEGHRVYTNTPFVFRHKGKEYKPILLHHKELEKAILTETNAVFLVDEAAIVFPNYFWNKLPVDYLFRFAQSRKYGLHFMYTTQRLNHTVIRLRDLTNIVVKVRKITVLGRFDFYENVYYDPEFFDFTVMSGTEAEKRYILGRKWILPNQARKLYGEFSTFYTVEHGLKLEQSDRHDKIQNKSK